MNLGAMVLTYSFPACWVHVDEAGHFLHTAFLDGAKLESIPDPEKDAPTALAYGYGDDALRLWREHDVLHHLIATFYGHGVSPTIWAVAHEDHPEALPVWIRLGEEEFVGHVHRWLNCNRWHDALCGLDRFGFEREELRDKIQQVLRGEILDARMFAPG